MCKFLLPISELLNVISNCVDTVDSHAIFSKIYAEFSTKSAIRVVLFPFKKSKCTFFWRLLNCWLGTYLAVLPSYTMLLLIIASKFILSLVFSYFLILLNNSFFYLVFSYSFLRFSLSVCLPKLAHLRSFLSKRWVFANLFVVFYGELGFLVLYSFY